MRCGVALGVSLEQENKKHFSFFETDVNQVMVGAVGTVVIGVILILLVLVEAP